MILDEKQTINFVGGAGALTAALVTATINLVKAVYSIGQNLGSTIRRAIAHNNC